MKMTIEQLKAEKEFLTKIQSEQIERKRLEAEVKFLKSKVNPSKFRKIVNALTFVGTEVVAGAKAFDAGLQKLDDSYAKATEEAPKRRNHK